MIDILYSYFCFKYGMYDIAIFDTIDIIQNSCHKCQYHKITNIILTIKKKLTEDM